MIQIACKCNEVLDVWKLHNIKLSKMLYDHKFLFAVEATSYCAGKNSAWSSVVFLATKGKRPIFIWREIICPIAWTVRSPSTNRKNTYIYVYIHIYISVYVCHPRCRQRCCRFDCFACYWCCCYCLPRHHNTRLSVMRHKFPGRSCAALCARCVHASERARRL